MYTGILFCFAFIIKLMTVIGHVATAAFPCVEMSNSYFLQTNQPANCEALGCWTDAAKRSQDRGERWLIYRPLYADRLDNIAMLSQIPRV